MAEENKKEVKYKFLSLGEIEVDLEIREFYPRKKYGSNVNPLDRRFMVAVNEDERVLTDGTNDFKEILGDCYSLFLYHSENKKET